MNMRLETLDTTMRREQTKAEAVARLMASFASHLQAATTETVRETSKQADNQRLPQQQQAGQSPQPSSFFADLQPGHMDVSTTPKASDPVRPADTEQHGAASQSATADVSRSAGASDRIADLRPTASSVPPQSQTSSASQSASGFAAKSTASASSTTPAAKGASSAAHPAANAATPDNVAAQNSASSANAPAAPAAPAHDEGAKSEAGAVNANANAPAETAPIKVAGDAKASDVAPVTAEHAAVAAKGVKSVTQHASKDDEPTDAPAPTVAAPAQATDAATRTMMPEAAVTASRTAAAASTPPAEAPQIAPLTGAAPPVAMGIAPKPRAGANQPTEAEAPGTATPTPASARAGATDASHLDGADATIRPQADGGLLITLAPSANGPVQMKLDVAGGAVSNLVFIAPYQQTRNNLEALRPAIAAATRGGASMRIQSSRSNTPNATSQSLTETSGEGGDHPHIDVKI